MRGKLFENSSLIPGSGVAEYSKNPPGNIFRPRVLEVYANKVVRCIKAAKPKDVPMADTQQKPRIQDDASPRSMAVQSSSP
jgi:hypothetical protein